MTTNQSPRKDSQQSDAPEPENGQTLIEHLEELRWRLIWIIVALVIGTAVGWGFSRPILTHMISPVGETVFLAPGEAFYTHLRIAFIIGIVLAFPMFLFQIGAFVWPGLHRHERRLVLLFMPFSLGLFLMGIVFSYFVMLPLVSRFFLGFGSEEVRPAISIASYVSFVIGLILPSGLVFQMPVLSLLLARLGFITTEFLRRWRRIALFVVFVLAAFITPPDVISQIILAGPLLGLYELSILVARWGERARRAAS